MQNANQNAEKRLALPTEKRYNENTRPADNGLTETEEGALLAYKSGGSYSLNAKLRDGAELNEYEQGIVDNLDRALEKLPTYQGKVYRNIQFDGWGDEEARTAYVESHIVGETISYDAYTSTSTAVDGYPLEGEYVVRHIIQSANGRNMEGYGNNSENEVLFPRDVNFVTERVEYDSDGTPTIYLTEDAYGQQEIQPQTADGRGTQGDVARDNTGESRSSDTEANQSQVQRLRTQNTKDGKMQSSVPGWNTDGNSQKQENLRGVQAKVTSKGVGTQRLSEANADLDGYARENIKDYNKLSAPNQAEIRAMIREGRALGISESDVLLYAKISARTGVRVTFDRGKTLIGRRKGSKELVYADGFYDPATNEICVNPNGKRSADKLLIHELAHAIYGGEKGMRLAKRNVKNLSAEEKKAISDRYAEVERTDEIELLDEYNAHYAEGILGNAETLERLLDDAPTVKDRILDFLRGAKDDTDAQRSAAARRLFFKYKRLFDRFAQQNAQNIATERMPTAVVTASEKKTPHGEAPEANGETRINDEKMQVSGKKYAAGVRAYSYENLTKKNDLSVVELPSEIPQTADGKIDNKAIVARGKLNARKQNNPKNTGTDTYVRVDDIGLDVLLGTKGLQHGLVRSEETALVVMKIGDILKGSVAVNELNGNASRKTDMSYVLLGACRDGEKLFVVRSVVSKLQNDVTEIDVYQLSAVKGKKTETPNSALKRGAAVTEQGSLISSGSPTVSISDFLQYVKDIPLINEILSEDVANKLGVTRTNGTLTGDIRFALPEDTDTAEAMAEFTEEVKKQLNEETSREAEVDLARAKAEDAAAKEISRVKKREAKRADYWKEKAKENESRAKVLGNISSLAGKMKDLKLGTYHNATQDQSKQFAGSVEGLSKIVWNGNLSVKLARKHIGTLRAWYKQDIFKTSPSQKIM